MLELISQPWPWYVAGPMISLIMFLLLYFGKNFGLSSNLQTMCCIVGGGKCAELFNFNWKTQSWNLIFIAGTITGGYLSSNFLTLNKSIQVSENVISQLSSYGISNIGVELLPAELFHYDVLFTTRGLIMIVIGGFLVGFGSRYAGGCTSGHAISGLSDLQVPSLIAVIGFFIGGLLMTYFILPHILQL